MNLPTQQSYRLVPRGGAGLACDEEGLALGGVDLARAQTDARGVRRCVMRAPEETGSCETKPSCDSTKAWAGRRP